MVFPNTPLDIDTSMLINGTWTDVTSYVRAANGINIRGGRSSEQARISAAEANFTLNNRDGRFSNRNPLSPYYGLIPRNTQVRITAGTSTPHLKTIGIKTLGQVSTVDKSSLDIVGDIDIAIDCEPNAWVTGRGGLLASKYVISGSQRSWYFNISTTGRLNFGWSTDGTLANRVFKTSTTTIPTTNARLSLRVTLDVNNGAAGNTVTFYTSTSGVSGPWTQLGSAVVTAGVTSIYNSTAPVEIGTANNGGFNSVGTDNFDGKIYGFILKDGIGGTIVAGPDFTSQTIRADSFTDGASNVWNIEAPFKITDDAVRFTGELSELPVRWDKTGRDVWNPITASGILRRLSQGQSPLNSPVYRNLVQYQASSYWTMEDGSGSTQAGNAITGRSSAYVTNVSFGSDDTFPGSKGVVTINDSTSKINGSVGSIGSTSIASAMFYFKLPATPASDVSLIDFYCNGSINRWNISVGTTTYRLRAYDVDGVLIASSDQNILFGSGAEPNNRWIAMRIQATQVGANTSMEWAWYPIGGSTPFGITYTINTQSTKRITGFKVGGTTGLDGMKLAHVLISESNISFTDTDFINSSNAYVNETAGARIYRLCNEEDVPIDVEGNLDDTEMMGPQPLKTLLDIVYECIDLDGGLLYEPRDRVGISYLPRTSLLNQTSFNLPYLGSFMSEVPEPIEDDQNVVNDVTVSRNLGSSARVVKEDGPLSVLNPPSGIGRYTSTLTLNAAYDSQLDDLAGWAVFKGTWDESRYPLIKMNMARRQMIADTSLARNVLAANVGTAYDLTDLPSFVPPGPIRQMIQGYTEYLANFEWSISWNTSPYGPYVANKLITNFEMKADADGDTKVNTAFNSTATSISIKSAAGTALITTAAGNLPLDVIIGGERMTVTAVSGTTSPQTLTVTRSVNNIVKSHSVDETMYLFTPMYATL